MKYIEKVTKKYVIATLDQPTLYLKKTLAKNEYSFVEDIELATKTVSENVMKQILKYFYYDTNLTDLELVVIPITITYAIIGDPE